MASPFENKPVDKSPPAATSIFKGLAEDYKVGQTVIAEKLAAGHKPVKSERFSAENMRAWMDKSKKTKKSSICALMIGHPKIGKSGVLLDCLTDQDIIDGKKLIIFELNSDQGCDVNKKEFHGDNDNIIILNPSGDRDMYIQDKEGNHQLDYIAVMAKIKATIQTIKEDIENGDESVKAIGFDGLDIFLSEICESQMRMEEHIDAAGGVSMRYWKNRNKYYYDVLNMILSIDVDKYLITHYAPRSRDDKTGQYNDKRTVSKLNDNLVYSCQKSTTDKMHQIIEFTDHTQIKQGKKHVKIVATMIADRRSFNSYMDNITIAETGPDGKVVWNGKAILERAWV
jgi:hypothetical protein